MCFCTESRRGSDKVLEQCSYFTFTQIISSDKTEVREGEKERKRRGGWAGGGGKGKRERERSLWITPANSQGWLVFQLSFKPLCEADG